MEWLTLLRANIRHQKSSFIGIMILMFFVSLSLTTVLTIYVNTDKRVSQALKEDGYGYMVIQLFSEKVPNGDIVTLMNKIKENNPVESVNKVEAVYSEVIDLNGYTSDTVILQPEKQECFKFRIFNDAENGFLEKSEELKQGEVSVPISFKSLYQCKIGDRISFKSGGEAKEYTVKYFLEDPFCGSSMMGIKNVLMNNKDLEVLYQQAHNSKEIERGTILNIFKEKDSKIGFMKFERLINESSDVGGFARSSMGIDQAKGYMLLITNIFCGLLLSFIIVLIIVAVIVMNHNITSSIDLEYENLGILKAMGFSGSKLKGIYVLQYLISALAGSFLGIPVAIPIIAYVNRLTAPVTGLLVANQVAMLPCLGTVFILLLLIVLFVSFQLRKIALITPIQSIRGGLEPIYFKSRMEVGINKRCMNMLLALRQLTSNYKQYISSGMITALLVFFLIIVGNMGSGIGKDGKGLIQLFACMDSDLEINYGNAGIENQVEKTIETKSKIEGVYQTASSYLLINGCKVYSFMCSDPTQYNTILEGRTCLYENEILITKFIASDLELRIGDRVSLSYDGKKEEYLVSGIYQSANDMGMNIGLNKEGYDKLVDSDIVSHEYKLADSSQANEIVQELKRNFGDKIEVKTPVDGFGGIDSIVSAVNGLLLLVYIISILFVAIVIFLQCNKIFAKERQDYGIYKALGFTSFVLRVQFALRFMLVSGMSGLVGSLVSVLLRDRCMGFLFSFMGISNVTASTGVVDVIIPILFMMVVFFIFSYLMSRRIRKVAPRILISE